MNTIKTDLNPIQEKKQAMLGLTRRALRALLPILVVLAGWKGYSILSVELEQAKRPPGKPRALRTKVEELRVEDYRTIINTQGVIRPHNEVSLTAQVNGQVIDIDDAFEDGAFFTKGDVLVEIDPSVYLATLKGAQAQLLQAKAAHAQEKARAEQAKVNWNSLGYDEEPNELVLRLPQLREAEARVDSAAAQVERAQRDLDLTKIRAPFNGRVRQRAIGVSQAIGAGTPLGTIFAIDFAEVRLPISAKDMVYLTLPESPEDPPVEVELRDALGADLDTVWKAKIVRTEGTLDVDSLELFAIARIDDPFGRQTGLPPLRIGQPVAGAIPGEMLQDVIQIPREAIRDLNQVHLIDKEELTISSHAVIPVWKAEDHIVVKDPTIADGTLISMSRLHYAPNGAKVEIIEDLVDTGDDAEAASDKISASTK